jgi:hypothetical protein
MNMDDHSRTVDVADLQIQAFLEPQPQRVDGPEEGLVVRRAHGVDQTPRFSDAQDVGQALGSGDMEALKGEPVAWDGMRVEEYDAACGDLQRAGRILSLILEIEQVLTQFRFGNLVGRLAEVCGELPDGAEVHLLRTFGETGQLQILVHTLAKSGAHQWVLSKRRVEKPSGNPLCHRHNRKSPEPLALDEDKRPSAAPLGKASRSSCRAAAYLNLKLGLTPAKKPILTPRSHPKTRSRVEM